MSDATILAVLGTVVGMVIGWFVLIQTLFVLLRRRHPVKYADMGEPSLFWNNSTRSTWELMRFLLCRDHRPLNDRTVSWLADFMLIYFLLVLAAIGCWFYVALALIPPKLPRQ